MRIPFDPTESSRISGSDEFQSDRPLTNGGFVEKSGAVFQFQQKQMDEYVPDYLTGTTNRLPTQFKDRVEHLKYRNDPEKRTGSAASHFLNPKHRVVIG